MSNLRYEISRAEEELLSKNRTEVAEMIAWTKFHDEKAAYFTYIYPEIIKELNELGYCVDKEKGGGYKVTLSIPFSLSQKIKKIKKAIKNKKNKDN